MTPELLEAPHPREGEPDFEGYCITIFEGSVWLTKDGWITPVYEQRGIWQTWEEAQEALRRA